VLVDIREICICPMKRLRRLNKKSVNSPIKKHGMGTLINSKSFRLSNGVFSKLGCVVPFILDDI